LWKEYIEIVFHLAVFEKYLYTRGLWDEALRLLTMGNNATIESGAKNEQALFLWTIGTLQREMGNYPDALTSFDQSLQIGIESKNLFLEASALMGKGYVLLYSANYNDAFLILERAVKLAKESGNNMALGEALRGLGRVALSRGQLEIAVDYFNKSEPVLKATDNKQGLAYNYRALGEIQIIYSKTNPNKIQQGHIYFDEGLRLAEEIGDPQAQAYIIRGKADAFALQGLVDKAINLYKQSEKLYRSIGDRAALAGTLCSIGDAYLAQENFEKAEGNYNEGEVLAFQMSLPRWQARSIFGRAKIMNAKGLRDQAEKLAMESRAMLHGVGHRDEEIVKEWISHLSSLDKNR
jgi:tetratricopeptide (TPR) repeat protein